MIIKLKDFFLNFLMNLSLRRKLLLLYLLFIMIPLGIFTVISNEKFSVLIENIILYSAKQSFDQTHEYLSSTLDRIYKLSDIVKSEQSIQNLLNTDPKSDVLLQNKNFIDASKFLSSTEKYSNLYKIRIYVSDDFFYSTSDTYMYSLGSIKNSIWSKKLINEKLNKLWCPPSYLEKNTLENNIEILSLARPICDPNNFHSISSFIRIDFDVNSVQEILKKSNPVNNSLTFIQNSEGVIVASSDVSLLNRYMVEVPDFFSLIYRNLKTQSNVLLADKYFILNKAIANTDWSIITINPVTDLLSESRKIMKEVLLIVFLIGSFTFLIATYTSHSITKRIYTLTKNMKEIQNGVLKPIKGNQYQDEIGELTKNYNFMTDKIANLLDEKYKSGKELKNTELKALQSQINPHFLYNTLDMINWMAQRNMNSEIPQLVRNLAGFYKLSLNGGRDMVSISDELSHISIYMEIQKMRFQTKLELVVDVPENIQNYLIPKITLQPIVENSILHGILGNDIKESFISIKGFLDTTKNEIILIVEDNGIGITEDNLRLISQGKLLSKSSSGFGIRNISDRIALVFGDEYGLTYQSEYGKGTSVKIKIPACKIDHEKTNIHL